MELFKLNDSILIANTQKLVQQEREILTQVLHHLREIDKRRLFSSLGFSSLFEFAVQSLGYSEDAAQRRISAMRLLVQVPEMEEKLEKGEITLTHLNLAQTHFRKEAQVANKIITKEEKLEFIDKLSGTSVREAQRVILQASSCPEALVPEKIKLVTPEMAHLSFSVPQEILKQIEQLKGMLAHKHPNLSTGELFAKLCELGLKEWDPAKSPAAPRVEKTSAAAAVKPKNRHLAASVKRLVFQRAQAKCQHCNSTYALQIDHIVPFAHGGTSEPGNLRLLCRHCNQRAAIQKFGINKMSKFLERGHL